MWPDPDIDTFVSDHFIPVRLHVKDQAEAYAAASERFGASWTPTTLLVDSGGTERHRIEGFLPKKDFLSQLELGLAHIAFHEKRFGEAEKGFEEIVSRFPDSDAAPEAQYWAGVSRYKASGDPKALGAIRSAFQKKYADTVWAKKASVWNPA